MYVPSGVHVPIMGNTAFRTNPMASLKRKRVEKMSTVETAFGRRIPLVNLDQGTSIPLGFVF